MSDITVVVASIPTRKALLGRALTSAAAQDLSPAEVIVAVDHDHEGAPRTRQRALDKVTTEWVAFLDDDDELDPMHLRLLKMHQESHGADMVYPWFRVVGGGDPFPHHENKPWDDGDPHQTTITFLARTSVVRAAGGFSDPIVGGAHGFDSEGNRIGEDYLLVLSMVKLGARIVHLPMRTWTWHHHGLGAPGRSGNTSGLPERW